MNSSFALIIYNGDNTIKMLIYYLGGVDLNIVARRKYVRTIKRSILIVKNCTRCTTHNLFSNIIQYC